MIKHGRTSSGSQRWRCTDCSATGVARREDPRRAADFVAFMSYVLGKDSQAKLDGTKTGRTSRRRFGWCWKVPTPSLPVTGEIYDQIFLDGKRMAYKWVLLVAINDRKEVVAWQWADGESTAAYRALLEPVPMPLVVTIDGAQGGLTAVKNGPWQEALTEEDTADSDTNPTRREILIQRCLIHVHRNNTRDLTHRPKTDAGKALLGLSKKLLTITTIEEAVAWEHTLHEFYQVYKDWINERTYAKDDPAEAAKRGKKPTSWWYTHGRDRKVYQRLARLRKEEVLFTYLTAIEGQKLHATTNIVESLNAQIDIICFEHRGLAESHMISAIDWYLYSQTESPLPTRDILKQWEQAGKPTRQILPKKTKKPQPESPPQYDTGLTTEEGLYTRKGWAGRWKP